MQPKLTSILALAILGLAMSCRHTPTSAAATRIVVTSSHRGPAGEAEFTNSSPHDIMVKVDRVHATIKPGVTHRFTGIHSNSKLSIFTFTGASPRQQVETTIWTAPVGYSGTIR